MESTTTQGAVALQMNHDHDVAFVAERLHNVGIECGERCRVEYHLSQAHALVDLGVSDGSDIIAASIEAVASGKPIERARLGGIRVVVWDGDELERVEASRYIKGLDSAIAQIARVIDDLRDDVLPEPGHAVSEGDDVALERAKLDPEVPGGMLLSMALSRTAEEITPFPFPVRLAGRMGRTMQRKLEAMGYTVVKLP